MRLSVRDGLATMFVAAAVVVYGLWASGAALASWSAREIATAVFALGFITCVTDQKQMAVVYGAASGQRRPPTAYTALVSVLGAAALAAGIIALVTGSTAMVAALTAAVAALWFAATARHALTPANGRPARWPTRTA
jgi:hypothetical protein